MTPKQREIQKQKVEAMVRKANRKRRVKAVLTVVRETLKFTTAAALVTAAIVMLYVIAGAYRAVIQQTGANFRHWRAVAAKEVLATEGITFAADWQTAPAMERVDFDSLAAKHAIMHGVSPKLLRALIKVESSDNLTARSPKGAQGMCQLMPADAQWCGLRPNLAGATIDDIAGCCAKRLAYGIKANGDTFLGLVDFNGGPKAVRAVLQCGGRAECLGGYVESWNHARSVINTMNALG